MSSDYGVTTVGFKRPRLPEIKLAIEEELSEAFGVPVNTRPDSVIGQLIGVFADREATLWEQMEKVYYAMYPNTADGVNLDSSVAFGGVYRIGAEKTQISATCYGKNQTVIPAGARIESSILKAAFATPDGGLISMDTSVYAEIVVAMVIPGDYYSLTIDGQTYSYTATANDNETNILVGLAAQLDASIFTATTVNGVLTLKRSDERVGSAIATSTNLQAITVGSPITFVCEDYGTITPGLGTVNKILTQIAGWERVSNNIAAVVGRETESDVDLRLRYGRSVYTKGAALIEAMQARIYEEVEGITAVLVFENDTDAIDSDSRPPHSLEVVVQGGDDTAIAKKIWQTKAPGIGTFGSTAVNITDSQGTHHVMKFNRPIPKKVWLKVVLSRNPDEDFPGDTTQLVQQIILSEGQKQKIGQNVVLQKFYGPVYRQTLGIGGMTITAGVGDVQPAAGAYTTDNVTIGVRELAEFALERIEVTVL